MSSILRTSKFVRYFVNCARNVVLNQSRDGFVQQHQLLVGASYRDYASAAPAEQPLNNIDKWIRRLDQDVKKTGRISIKELNEVFEEISKSKHATSTQSLMVIRCCGNLVPEEAPEVRTKLVNKIWQTLESLGIPMDISHYNTLLLVYLENEHQFSPSEFLAELESKGIEPNRVTFQRLISAYCQRGDIEGATSILEFMKEKQMPMSENVFNSLITGHSQADDLESATGILSIMKQAGIEPSVDTYTALLCGYAKAGDLDKIMTTIEDCQHQEISISAKNLLDIAYSLAINNHLDAIEPLLKKARKNVGYNQDAKNIVLRLIARGCDKAAVQILRTMTPVTAVTPDGRPAPVGTFLIRQLVKSNRPIESILSLCHELKESKENERALAVAVEACLHSGPPDLGLKLLSALGQEEELCPHYFWPIIIKYGKAKNKAGVQKTLKQMMTELNQPLMGETIREYALNYLSEGELAIQELRQVGISQASAAASVVAFLLGKSQIQKAAELALLYRANYNLLSVRRQLVHAFLNTKDVDALITVLRVIESSSAQGDQEENVTIEPEPVGRVLTDIVSALKGRSPNLVEQILQKCLDVGLGISNSAAEVIQSKLPGDQLTQEISSLLAKLTSSDLKPVELQRPASSKILPMKDEAGILATMESLEKLGEPTKGLQRQLLTLYCYNRDLEKAEALRQKMIAEGFEFGSGLIALLTELYVHHNDLDKATEMYKTLSETSKPAFDETKVLRFATALIKAGRLDEAYELFQAHKLDSSIERGFLMNSLTWRLLNHLADEGKVEELEKTFQVMKDTNFLEASNVMLGPLIKVHLVRGDLESALNKFEECCTLYHATPFKNDLACKLIEKEDAAALQRLTDLSTQIHGEVNSLYDLVLSFVETGRIRQARKILETPGLRAKAQRINVACERYTNEGKISYVENLIEATKDLIFIDRSDIYYHLLCSYCKTDDVDKALSLWTQMQDEDVQPKEMFLVKLAELLRQHNRPVPFVVPQVTEELEDVPSVVPSTVPSLASQNNKAAIAQIKALRRAVFSRQVEQALAIKENIKDEDLFPGDRATLLNLLITHGLLGEATKMLLTWLENGLKPNLRALNFAINSLAKAGDISSLNAIEGYLNDDLKKFTSFSNRYAHCMVEANKGEQLLNKWETDFDEAVTKGELSSFVERFPRGGVFSLLDRCPELIPKIESLALKFKAQGILDLTNALWVHYFINGETERANKLWADLKNQERLMFLPIIKKARHDKNIQLAENLLNHVLTSGVASSAKGSVYDLNIDLNLGLNRLEDAEAKLKEALNVVSIDELRTSTILRMKAMFQEKSLPFNYPIPSKKAKSSSSSSSSSDSDDEDTRQKSST